MLNRLIMAITLGLTLLAVSFEARGSAPDIVIVPETTEERVLTVYEYCDYVPYDVEMMDRALRSSTPVDYMSLMYRDPNSTCRKHLPLGTSIDVRFVRYLSERVQSPFYGSCLRIFLFEDVNGAKGFSWMDCGISV